ncbi:TPA: hypothetical protein PBT65_001714 [Staphylococcus aureus]|nr:hypothetical protein [Staphylococcus aureus]
MSDKKDDKDGLFSKIVNGIKSISRTIKNNPAISKTIIWTLSLLLLFVSIGGGLVHKHRVETKRAFTLSNIDQDIAFSLTGTEVQLAKQKRYKDVTIIPIKFDSGEKQSLNAKDYLVGLESKKGKPLKNISASLASFSTNGNMVLVLKGDLPKQPIQVLLRNDNNYSDSEDSEGTYLNWGKEQKTKQNVVAFVINPKGNNLIKDKRINSGMTMSDLYSSAFGDAQLKLLDKERSKTEDKLSKLNNQKEEYTRQIKQLNKALDRKEEDFELSRTDNNEDDDTGYESKLDDDDYNSLENSDLSSSDMESLRNTKINKYDSSNDAIKDEKRNLDAIDNKEEEVKNDIKHMYELTTISHRFKIINS